MQRSMAVSNLCWKEDQQQDSIIRLLDKYAIENIELCVSKQNYSKILSSGAKIIAYQSIIDRDIDLTNKSHYQRLRNSVLSKLDATENFTIDDIIPIVIGAPKSRIVKDLKDYHTILDNLMRLQVELNHKYQLNLEPVHEKYGTNFCNTLSQTLSAVKDTNLKVNLDIGNLVSYQFEDVYKINKSLADKSIGHSHLSSPDYGVVANNRFNRLALKLLKSSDIATSLEAFDLSIDDLNKSISNMMRMK